MGMYDELTCEMLLPEQPRPPKCREFQTTYSGLSLHVRKSKPFCGTLRTAHNRWSKWLWRRRCKRLSRGETGVIHPLWLYRTLIGNPL